MESTSGERIATRSINLSHKALHPKATVTVAGHERKKVGRKPIDPSHPRIEVLHDISDEEKQCRSGDQLVRIAAREPTVTSSGRRSHRTATRPRTQSDRLFLVEGAGCSQVAHEGPRPPARSTR